MTNVACKNIGCRYISKNTKVGVNGFGLKVNYHYCMRDMITISEDIYDNKSENITRCVNYRK